MSTLEPTLLQIQILFHKKSPTRNSSAKKPQAIPASHVLRTFPTATRIGYVVFAPGHSPATLSPKPHKKIPNGCDSESSFAKRLYFIPCCTLARPKQTYPGSSSFHFERVLFLKLDHYCIINANKYSVHITNQFDCTFSCQPKRSFDYYFRK